MMPSFSDAVYVTLLRAYFPFVFLNINLVGRMVHTTNIYGRGCDEDTKIKTADCSRRGLDAVPPNLSEDIEQLNLGYNQITSLLNSSFQRYTKVEVLDLTRNDIRVIEYASFYPLKELSTLNVQDNYHLVLPDAGLFRWNGKLANLDLSDSNLMSLPNDTLTWSSLWESLSLSGNTLHAIYCGNSSNRIRFVGLSNNKIRYITPQNFTLTCRTDVLNLEFNPIAYVDPKVIASLKVGSLVFGSAPMSEIILKNILLGISRSSIKELHINYSNLTILQNDTFASLYNYPLSVLNFEGNYLNLYPKVFSSLTRLQELNLVANHLGTCVPDFFEGMQKLRVLKLNYNGIRDIKHHGRGWPVDLDELHLSQNSLIVITPATFSGLVNLSSLYLRDDDISLVNITAFKTLENLHILDMSGCRIAYLQFYVVRLTHLYIDDNRFLSLYLDDAFEHLPSLLHLSLTNSRVIINNIWDSAKNVSVFDALLNLIYLDLSENSFGSLDGPLQPGVFQELSSLEELRLSKCRISYLHPLLFHGLISLKLLNISGNVLQYLDQNVLQVLTQITIIDVSSNSIDHLNKSMFSNNLRLEKLSLANNKISHLEHGAFEPLIYCLLSLDLSKNPIDCTCDLKWFRQWLRGNEDRVLEHSNDTFCSLSSLSPFRNKPLVDFQPDAICRPNIVLLCIIPLSALCLVVILVLMYHNRWLLKHKLFLLKLAAIGYHELQDARNHNEYEFDVNIIFYDDDEEWIRQHLRPALKVHLPQFQRNVFGDEDLVLGMHYLDSVDYVVTHSYKTVIVLSRACVEDRWFMLKLRIAMDHVSDTRTEFVLVIFRECIPDNEIPFLARLYLSDGRPYLHWPEDPRGQEYFWDELARSLTVNIRTNDLIPNE